MDSLDRLDMGADMASDSDSHTYLTLPKGARTHICGTDI